MPAAMAVLPSSAAGTTLLTYSSSTALPLQFPKSKGVLLLELFNTVLSADCLYSDGSGLTNNVGFLLPTCVWLFF